MHAVAYVIVGLTLFGAFALGAGVCAGVWLGVRALRPELLERP